MRREGIGPGMDVLALGTSERCEGGAVTVCAGDLLSGIPAASFNIVVSKRPCVPTPCPRAPRWGPRAWDVVRTAVCCWTGFARTRRPCSGPADYCWWSISRRATRPTACVGSGSPDSMPPSASMPHPPRTGGDATALLVARAGPGGATGRPRGTGAHPRPQGVIPACRGRRCLTSARRRARQMDTGASRDYSPLICQIARAYTRFTRNTKNEGVKGERAESHQGCG